MIRLRQAYARCMTEFDLYYKNKNSRKTVYDLRDMEHQFPPWQSSDKCEAQWTNYTIPHMLMTSARIDPDYNIQHG